MVTKNLPKRNLYPVLTLFLMVLITFGNNTIAQTKHGTIKGTVKDQSTGEALIGANVFIKALNTGAATDIDGKFEIANVPEGTYLVNARFVSYKDQALDVIVKGGITSNVNFTLVSSPVQMNEVVVTGQGIATERRKLTSSVSTINTENIKAAPVESLDQLLQGRVTGLNSFSSSGMPGTAGRVSARGLKSVLTSSTPVVYVDNVRVDNQDAFRLALDTGGAESSALADLVIGEIDRIEVIKGGAASTLFGSEAANGVIQIFTKKGMPGKTQWSINTTSGFDAPNEKFVTEQFIKDKVLKTGYYQSYSFNASGGEKNFTFNVGGKTYMSDGVLLDNMMRSKSYSFNGGFRALLSDISTLELSSSYTKSQYRRATNNNVPTAPYGGFEDGSRSDLNGYNEASRDSILNIMTTDKISDDIDRFRVALNLDLTPNKQFTNRFTFGIDYRKNEERDYVPIKSGLFFFQEGGYLYRADREYMTVTISYAGSYILPKIGPIEQTIGFGATGFRVEDRESAAQGEKFTIPGTDDFDNASQINAQENNRQLFNGGFHIVDQIGLFDRIFMDLGFRVDGNSTFGKEIGLQFYPKAGIAYNISEEEFFPVFIKEYVSTLKLRTSWGQTGNFPPPFTRDRTYAANSFLSQSGLGFANPGNNDLKPEKTNSLDLGFDMGLLNDKISLEFTYFNQLTKDALFQVPKDPASGFGLQWTNVGKISNKGIEIGIDAEVIQTENVLFNLRVGFSTLENKVESLGGAAPFDLSSFTFLPRRVEEGQTLGVFRVGVPIKDANGNYTGQFERVLTGSPLPKQSGNVSFNLTLFRNLTISSLTEFAFGHQIVNLKKTLRYFNGTEDTKDIVPENYSFESASSVWLEDADWIKIREIALNYRFPEGLLKGLSISASLRNVAEFGIKTTALDPELNSFQPNLANTGGYGYLDISAPRQFRLGLTYNL